jgi:amidohydrolase
MTSEAASFDGMNFWSELYVLKDNQRKGDQYMEQVFAHVDALRDDIRHVSEFIHQHPEVGHQEHQSSAFLIEELKKKGFTVEANAAGLPTAFKAVYQGKGPGPAIAFCAEYDALPEIGHACGHNLIAAAAFGAACALVTHMPELDGSIIVMGTPAEEVSPPVKGIMIEKGVFEGVDVALTIHGGDRTAVGMNRLAVDSMEITYTGRTSHAAASADRGRSALDGALLAMHAIEMLREHVRQDTRIHGIIKDGGAAANIVPGRAVLHYMVRALDSEYVDHVAERMKKCFAAGALATETEMEIRHLGKLDSAKYMQTLNSRLIDYAEKAGAIQVLEPSPTTASTDFGNVSHAMPAAELSVGFVPVGTAGHSREYREAAKSETGLHAAVVGAKAMAALAYDLLTESDYLASVKAEFVRRK